LLDRCEDRFRELQFVTDKAVDCWNYYVHGTRKQAFDYDRHFEAVVFERLGTPLPAAEPK
jgi:hypothetical protein